MNISPISAFKSYQSFTAKKRNPDEGVLMGRQDSTYIYPISDSHCSQSTHKTPKKSHHQHSNEPERKIVWCNQGSDYVYPVYVDKE